MKVVAIFLGLAVHGPIFEKIVFHGIVMDGEKNIGVVLVRHLRAFDQADLTAAGINQQRTSKSG